jgi:purine-binding chemotaxis protein CheW
MQDEALVSTRELALSDTEQVVSFRIAHETMAVAVAIVSEIVRMRDITEVPQVPPFVQGVMNLRGHIIPVLNLRARLKMPRGEDTRETRIVVVEVHGESIGMIVDAVEEVVTLSQHDISPPSPVVVSVETDFVRGIARHDNSLIVLLDVERVTTTGRSAEATPMLTSGELLSLPPAPTGSGAA